MGILRKTIESRLIEGLAPTTFAIEDVSEQHRGHGGYREGGESHFDLFIVSDRFRGLTRVARQRLVYECLDGLMGEPIHALSIQAKSPEEHERA